ncbi:hypothetical protein [Paenibacillus aceti]|uniref:Peptidase n=1 Tax=Paenibacillus aceti TaxID=1820010 RepID=A0ABQ1W2U1_9BACL|nr:hypothetical protein [Paenibacillus aceti]GGG08702.1 hypothetical protein GCM10010913_33080 [Paenibacillus aceti]
MSLCVFLQSEDHIIVGADTAISHTIDGKRCRGAKGIEKLVQVDQYLLFICGDLSAALDVVSSFRREKVKSIFNLQRIIKQRYRQILMETPEKVKAAEEVGESLLGVACFEIDSRGRTVSHSFNYNTGFKDEKRIGKKGFTHLVAGGCKSDKALELATASNLAGVKNPRTLIKGVFESLAGGDIGGDLTLYRMDAFGAKLLSREKINEVVKYPIIDMESMSGGLTGGTITGALMRTALSGERVETDSRGWRVYDSSNTVRISISQNNQHGSNAIHFSSSRGLDGYLNGQPGLMTLAASGNLFLAAVGGTVQVQGRTYFSDPVEFGRGATGISISNVDGLQSELYSLRSLISDKPSKSETATNMTFDTSTRNLKLYSTTGQTLAIVNIPK